MSKSDGQCPEFQTWAEYDAWVAERDALRDGMWRTGHFALADEGMVGVYGGDGVDDRDGHSGDGSLQKAKKVRLSGGYA